MERLDPDLVSALYSLRELLTILNGRRCAGRADDEAGARRVGSGRDRQALEGQTCEISSLLLRCMKFCLASCWHAIPISSAGR
jgi:hypothetical protein